MLAALTAALLLATPDAPLPTGEPSAPEGPNPFLIQAKELHQSLDFEKCLLRTRQAAQWRSTSKELVELELVAGMCAYGLNRRGDAREHFRLALRLDENAMLPAYSSPKLVDFFLWVKKRLQAPAPPMPSEDLPPDAPVDTQLTPAPRTELPPEGPGTHFTLKPVTVVLAVTAVVAVAVGAGLGANARGFEERARTATFESDYRAYANAARGNALGANIAYGASGAAALGAVIALFATREADDDAPTLALPPPTPSSSPPPPAPPPSPAPAPTIQPAPKPKPKIDDEPQEPQSPVDSQSTRR